MPFTHRYSAMLATALLLVHTTSASLVEVFSDASCQTETHHWLGRNGYPNGECAALSQKGNFSSFKFTDLSYGCAVTIYGPGTQGGPCNPKAAPGAIVAVPGHCYNTTWAFYSIDSCKRVGSASPASSSTPLASSTASPTGKTTTVPNTSQKSQSSVPSSPFINTSPHSSTNIGAIVGGVVGGVAFGIIIAAIGILVYLRRRRVQRNKPPPYTGDAPGSSHGLADMTGFAKELPGGSNYSSRAELPQGGTYAEMGENHIAELPDRQSYGMDLGVTKGVKQ